MRSTDEDVCVVDVSLDDAKPQPWLLEIIEEWKRLAFEAGYRACYDDIEDYDHNLEKMIVYRFSEWRKTCVTQFEYDNLQNGHKERDES